jgi:polyisoprenoid-binding protein YceI
MRGTRRVLWIVLAVSLVTPPGARADHVRWTIAPDESRIVFEYVRNGQAEDGTFGTFAGTGTFHPEAPGEATFEIEIASDSIDLGDAKASAFATSAEWFDARNHPEVVYRLRKLTPLGDDRYRAEGDLTIRGRTRPVATTITLDINGEDAHATGTLSIERKDYMLGVGPLSLFVDIGPEVAVRFDLTAHPVR